MKGWLVANFMRHSQLYACTASTSMFTRDTHVLHACYTMCTENTAGEVAIYFREEESLPTGKPGVCIHLRVYRYI